VWEGPFKNDIFAPTWHPYRFQKFELYVFYSIPYAICLESLVDIRSAILEKSSVNDKCGAQVRVWVKTHQCFSCMAWPIFVRFSPSGTEFMQPKSDRVAFLIFFSFGRHIGFSVVASGQKVTFWPTFSIPVHLPSAWKVWLIFLSRSGEKLRVKI